MSRDTHPDNPENASAQIKRRKRDYLVSFEVGIGMFYVFCGLFVLLEGTQTPSKGATISGNVGRQHRAQLVEQAVQQELAAGQEVLQKHE